MEAERTDLIGSHPAGADRRWLIVDLPSKDTRWRELVPAQRVDQIREHAVDRVRDSRVDVYLPPHGRVPIPHSSPAPTPTGRGWQMRDEAITRSFALRLGCCCALCRRGAA